MAKFPNGLRFREIPTPTTPPSGAVVIYPKDDGLMYAKNSDGVEYPLGTQMGGAGEMIIREYNSTTTWEVPENAYAFEFIIVGAAGGGGAGRRGLSSTFRRSGGGGGGAGVIRRRIAAENMPGDTPVFDITIGAGGAGAPANNTNNNNGAQGGSGGLTSITYPAGTTNVVFLRAGGATGGLGGSNTSGGASIANGGGVGNSVPSNVLYVWRGSSGGISTVNQGGLGIAFTLDNTSNAGYTHVGAGGGGGGITDTNTSNNGGRAYSIDINNTLVYNTGGSTPVTEDGPAGLNNITPLLLFEFQGGGNWISYLPGTGGSGGGAGTASANAGNGGAGGLYGCGGGGGGASLNGFIGGGGGAGAQSCVIIIEYY